MDPKTIVIVAAIAIFAIYAFFSHRKRQRIFAEQRRFHSSTLVSVLLNLPDNAVKELMELYKKEFGAGPARYARQTMKKWRTGKVQPANQTFNRFLVHLPRIMSYDLKCEVLRHFMQEFAGKNTFKLDVTTEDWERKLTPLITQIIDKAHTAELPDEVERQLKWLGDGDMQAAQNILRASQAEESRIMVSQLRDEFHTIEGLLAEEHLKPRVTHMLKFPYGTIELNIQRR